MKVNRKTALWLFKQAKYVDGDWQLELKELARFIEAHAKVADVKKLLLKSSLSADAKMVGCMALKFNS